MKEIAQKALQLFEKNSLPSLKHILVIAVFLSALKIGFSQTLIYGVENEIKDFNLLTSLDKNAFALNELFSQSLFYKKVDGSMQPDLVESAKYLAAEWRLQIKEATYSNSKKLTCEDIVVNLKEAQKSKSLIGLRLKDISSVECVGRELRIKTYHPSPELMKRVGSMLRIYEPSTLYEKIPIGSGPYKIQIQKAKDLILLSNPFYKGERSFSEIRYRTLRDPWLRDLALMSGNVDFLLENFSHTRILSFEKNPLLRVYRNPSSILHYIGFHEKKINKDIRKQIQSLLFESDLIAKFWGKDVDPSFQLFEKTNLSQIKTKTSKGKSIASSLKLELSCVADESTLQFLTLLAQDLKSKGVTLKIRPLEFATFMKTINSQNFEAYFFYVDVGHVQNLEALFASKGNRLGIANPKIDPIFSDLKSSAEQSLEELNREEAYMLPLYRTKKILAMGQNVHIDQSSGGFWRDLIRAVK